MRRLSLPPRVVLALRRAVHWVLFLGVRGALALLPSARRNDEVRRSVWTGNPILTLATNARAERLLGIAADSLVFNRYRTSDAFDYDFSRWTRWWPVRIVLPYLVFVWACVRYQRFHAFYNRGVLPSLEPGQFNPDELAMLRRLGKELYVYAYGADVRTQRRTRALGPIHLCAACPAVGRHCVCDDVRGSDNYRRVRLFATECFSWGDMTAYTPGSRNDLFYWPIDLAADAGRRYAPHYPEATSTAPLRIVHASNHRHFKGTHHLIAAAEQLRREGHALELTLVENRTHAEALELLRSADVVFDQCLAGFHGYAALEAMALGKPVLSYVRQPSVDLLEPEECPLVLTHVATLTDDLRRLVARRTALTELGRRGRAYIERHYSLAAFAERLRRVYQGEAPTVAATTIPARRWAA